MAIIDRSFNSVKAKFNDLGMGVAERLIISTSSFKDLIYRKVSIYGGSNEIQRNVISKAILGL